MLVLSLPSRKVKEVLIHVIIGAVTFQALAILVINVEDIVIFMTSIRLYESIR